MMVDVKALSFATTSDEMDVAGTSGLGFGKTLRNPKHRLGQFNVVPASQIRFESFGRFSSASLSFCCRASPALVST